MRADMCDPADFPEGAQSWYVEAEGEAGELGKRVISRAATLRPGPGLSPSEQPAVQTGGLFRRRKLRRLARGRWQGVRRQYLFEPNRKVVRNGVLVTAPNQANSLAGFHLVVVCLAVAGSVRRQVPQAGDSIVRWH